MIMKVIWRNYVEHKIVPTKYGKANGAGSPLGHRVHGIPAGDVAGYVAIAKSNGTGKVRRTGGGRKPAPPAEVPLSVTLLNGPLDCGLEKLNATSPESSRM